MKIRFRFAILLIATATLLLLVLRPGFVTTMKLTGLPLLASWLGHASSSSALPTLKTDGEPLRNANHVFNAIHSSMRQWGSSLNHNGMSLFLAKVPAGTTFYHGSSKNTSVVGLEWLAFEPEHAIMFTQAHPGMPGAPPRPPPQISDECETALEYTSKSIVEDRSISEFIKQEHDVADADRAAVVCTYNTTAVEELPLRLGQTVLVHEKDDSGWWLCESKELNGIGWTPSSFLKVVESHKGQSKAREQTPMKSVQPDRSGPPGHDRKRASPGWLHTYITKHDLNLLYIDGTSAGKSDLGTLDTQDYLLSHPSVDFNEHARAEDMCNRSKNSWGNHIDGFIRMEMGFEIILCSFADHLDTLRITRGKGLGPDGRFGDRNSDDDLFFYSQMTESRFPGIGGSRVSLNYHDFISLFSYDLHLFNGSTLPRIVNISTDALKPVQDDIDILAQSSTRPDWLDWRSVADMIVTRYAVPLAQLNSSQFPTLDSLHLEAQRLLRPFIDYDDRNTTAEIARCAMYALSDNYTSSKAGRIIHVVSHRICSTISSIYTDQDYEHAMGRVRDLVAWLQWTTWKECRGCAWDEVCYTAVWPYGTQEDHDHPRCVNKMATRGRGYWRGGPGGPGGPGRRPPQDGGPP